MTTLITYNNGHISKEWYINEDKLQYFELFKDIENELDLKKERIKLANITDNNFAIIYKLIFCNNNTELIQNIEKYDYITLIAIYNITDFLIIKKLQNIIGDEIAKRLNNMNIIELQNIIDIF
jgi:hypothetical protein